MDKYILLSFLIGLCFAGCGIAFWLKGKILAKRFGAAETQAFEIVERAKIKAENFLKEAELEAKDRLIKLKSDFDTETKETGAELEKQERHLFQKEEKLDKKIEQIEEKALSLTRREHSLKNKEKEIEKNEKSALSIVEEQEKKLETIAGMTFREAKEFLLKSMENEAKYESVKFLKQIEAETKEAADKKAKEIIATAIQRYAGDYVSQRTVSVVGLPNDEMKGRIIGREGRNIRSLEAATGIDFVIDDTPEAVVLSGFNPVRREVARLSLEALIADGRIHPGRIEEVVKKAEEEVEQIIKEAGEQAVFDLGIHGIHKELIKYLGRLKFRTSYAQNVLQHSIEVGSLSGVIASELGLNPKLAKRIGLLHDIGKSIDREVEGTHALIGARLAKKSGEKSIVINAIAAHHEETPVSSVYDWIVQAADSISGARPGARKEIIENYIKRLEDLEGIANSFDGISNSYAVQAGRELRVLVESGNKSDEDAFLLSKEIVKKIEETMTFPGQIKVMVIRETRAIEYANK
ncbi:MAG: ribonuclease Y [Deltaproteobacteria bacterium]|nr:ribonuclease Y [Deltaproteobacteria bacterium]